MDQKILLGTAIQAQVPTIVVGPPGSGKTKTTEALCRSLGTPFYTIAPNQRQATEICGFPWIEEGHFTFMAPDWAHRIRAHKGPYAVIIEDANWTPHESQAAILRMLDESKVGDFALPNVSWVLLCNDYVSTGGVPFISPLANRCFHMTWDRDLREWAQGMLTAFPEPKVPRLPENWRSYIKEERALLASFGLLKGSLFGEPTDEAARAKPWLSERSAERSTILAAAIQSLGLGGEYLAAAYAGWIGEGATLDFVQWREKLDLPEPNDVLDGKIPYTRLGRDDRDYSFLMLLVARVAESEGEKRKRWEKGWKIVAQAYDEGLKDIAALAGRGLLKTGKDEWELPNEILKFEEWVRKVSK